MESFSEQMLQALEEERMEEAQLFFEQALKKDSPELLSELADVLFQMGFLEETKRILESIIEVAEEKEPFYLTLAEIAVEAGENEEAFMYLDQIDEESEYYPQKLLVSADLYQLLGIPEVSEQKLLEAQRILPDEPLIQFALGDFYTWNEEYQEALATYRTLEEQGVDEYESLYLDERLARSLSMLGAFEDAIGYYESALSREYKSEYLFQLAFVYLQLKEYQKAITYLEELRALDPDYLALYLLLAEALKEEERIEEAAAVLADGIEKNPYHVDLYLLASEMAYRLHDQTQSEAYLLQALTLGERSDDIRLTLSNLYVAQAEYENAIEVIQGMEESEHPYALWNLAKAYDQLEEFDLAAKNYQQASEDLAHEPEFLKEYAIFLRQEGQLTEAKKMLEHFLHHEPGDLEALSLLEDLSER